MGDGGCAVLSTRHPLVQVRDSNACHRQQIRGKRDWAGEFISLAGLARTSLSVAGDHKSCLWASVATSNMEPHRSSHVGEITGEEDYNGTGAHTSRREKSTLSSENAIIEGSTSERRKDPDHEAPSDPSCKGSGAGLKQRTEDGSKCSGDLESRFTKGHSTSGREIEEEPKDRNVDDRSGQGATGDGHCLVKGNVDGRNEYRVNSTRDNEDSTSKFAVSKRNKRGTVRGTSLSVYSGGGHVASSREGNHKESGNKSHSREHSTGSGHHGSKKGDGLEHEPKSKKSCDWSEHDSYHHSARVGRRKNENGVRCSSASDNRLSRGEGSHHHAERDSHHGNRWRHNTRARSHESESNLGHGVSSNHRNNPGKGGGRSSSDNKNGHRSHCRDHHGRRWNDTEKNGSHRNENHLERSGERSQALRTDGRQHREERNWNEHPKEKRDLEEKSAELKGDCVQESAVDYGCPSDITCKDDSGSVEADVPMDLSPAPADDCAGRFSEVAWIGPVQPGVGEQITIGSSVNELEPRYLGWIFLDHKGNTQGPMELGVLKSLLENGKLQPDHMVGLDGSNEWVTLEHAGLSSEEPRTGAGLPQVSRSDVLSQLSQPSEGQSKDELCLPSHCADTGSEGRQCPPCGNAFDEKQTFGSHISDGADGLQIDKRVEQLMQGFALVPGREKEIILEALNNAARRVHLENEQELENEESPQLHSGLAAHWKEDQLISDGHCFSSFGLESQASKEPVPRTCNQSDVNLDGVCVNSFQSARKWTSRGGDWKLMCRTENSATVKGQVNIERSVKERVVLNGGIPLCESRHSSLPDPRKQPREPSLCDGSAWRILELPPWAPCFREVKGEFRETGFENMMRPHQPFNATSKLALSTPKSQASTHIAHFSSPKGGAHSEVPKKTKAAQVNTASDQKVESNSVSLMGSKLLPQTLKGDLGMSSRHFLATKYAKLPSIAIDVSIELSKRVNSCEESSTSLAASELDYPSSQLMRHDVILPLVDEMNGKHATPAQQLSSKEHLKPEGDWYYRDGAGHEIGPFSLAKLQLEVQGGRLYEFSSVYRKSDDTWIQISADPVSFSDCSMENTSSHESGSIHGASKKVEWNIKREHATEGHEEAHIFPQLYSQIMGYMCGKLHEHVMKSYRSQDFRALLLEGSDKWFGDKQSRSTIGTVTAGVLQSQPTFTGTDGSEATISVPPQTSNTRSANSLSESKWDADKVDSKQRESYISDHMQSAFTTTSGVSPMGKIRRLSHIEDAQGEWLSRAHRHSELKESVLSPKAHTIGSVAEANENPYIKSEEASMKQDWGTIAPELLVRIFSFLDVNLRSLILASATCKSWRVALDKFKREFEQIDLSSLGSLCSDEVFQSFTEHAFKLSTIILKGCTMLSLSTVSSFLHGHRSITTVDINGCHQLEGLVHMFRNITWIGSKSLSKHQHGPADSHPKLKSLKLIGERKTPPTLKHLGLDGHSSDGSNSRDRRTYFEVVNSEGVIEPMDCDPPQSLRRDLGIASSNKRMKLSSTGKFLKSGQDSSHHKVVSRECAIIVDPHAMENEVVIDKHRQKSVYLLDNAHFLSTDKFPSMVSETDSPYVVEMYRKIEKGMAYILEQLKDADTKKFCFHQVSESEGISLTVIEDRLRGGYYQGNKGGLSVFKEDLFSLCRKVMRLGGPGKDMFWLAHRLVARFEKNLKTPPASRDSKLYKRKYPDSQSRLLAGRKRGIGDAMGKQGLANKRRGLDESSADDASEGSFLDKDVRKLHNFKRKHWIDWDAETSGSEEEEENLFQDYEEDDTDESEPDFESNSEEEGGFRSGKEDSSWDEDSYEDSSNRFWGARMTKASMVPPATRKYELIEEYKVVADEAEVTKRMRVNLPADYEEKLKAAEEKRGIEYSHLEIPESREYRPRKHIHGEVLEQEVYGIDPYTHNLLMDSMPIDRLDFPDGRRHQLIEEDLLKALNQEARQFTGSGKAPTKYLLEHVVEKLVHEARDSATRSFCSALLKNMRSRPKDKYVAYRKGLGVVCNHKGGFEMDEFIVEFFGEVYPAWRWFEKQDAIRSLQKKDKDPAPEFYNIFLERPKGDALGYDLVVVDAMHKANYASRICHACRPNCEARVTAVNGQYQIGVYTLRPVQYGEELTFDYNSVTESKEEYETSVCLCGSQGCRGSYLNLAGPETFQEVMKDCHGILHRHDLLLQACISSHTSREDWDDLRKAGVGSCLLEGLPDWTIRYAAGVVRFMNTERKSLPKEILKTIIKERRLETYGEAEFLEAGIQADGVFNSRLQNLAITLDKVRYVFKELYTDSTKAPPPLRKLEPRELISLIWKDENSVVAELLRGMAYNGSKDQMLEFKHKVREHEPAESGNVEKNLQQSLLWLRDELFKVPAACVSRHDAAADLIHLYAYTKLFFTSQDYAPVVSPPLTINPLDLGPKHAHTLGAASSQEWRKTYNKDYVLGQLIFWYKHNVADPGSSLAKAVRGCLILPEPMSCYAKSSQAFSRLAYGKRHRWEMFRRMEEQPQKQWSRQEFWEFKNNRGVLGSPMMDAIRQGTCVNKEMMDWLKSRSVTFVGPCDNQ